ncbi:hypothetical protein FB451DRAFT_1184430 [Mycena latifolia]|nr:hypothetical protein FB451DRAFT_1184430 [Mycena latifolia]
MYRNTFIRAALRVGSTEFVCGSVRFARRPDSVSVEGDTNGGVDPRLAAIPALALTRRTKDRAGAVPPTKRGLPDRAGAGRGPASDRPQNLDGESKLGAWRGCISIAQALWTARNSSVSYKVGKTVRINEHLKPRRARSGRALVTEDSPCDVSRVFPTRSLADTEPESPELRGCYSFSAPPRRSLALLAPRNRAASALRADFRVGPSGAKNLKNLAEKDVVTFCFFGSPRIERRPEFVASETSSGAGRVEKGHSVLRNEPLIADHWRYLVSLLSLLLFCAGFDFQLSVSLAPKIGPQEVPLADSSSVPSSGS